MNAHASYISIFIHINQYVSVFMMNKDTNKAVQKLPWKVGTIVVEFW